MPTRCAQIESWQFTRVNVFFVLLMFENVIITLTQIVYSLVII